MLEFGGKKEKESCFIFLLPLIQDHHQFIEDIEGRLGFRFRLRLRFSFLRLGFFLVCDWVDVIFDSGYVCLIVRLCCHCLLLYAIVLFVSFLLLFF